MICVDGFIDDNVVERDERRLIEVVKKHHATQPAVNEAKFDSVEAAAFIDGPQANPRRITLDYTAFESELLERCLLIRM